MVSPARSMTSLARSRATISRSTTMVSPAKSTRVWQDPRQQHVGARQWPVQEQMQLHMELCFFILLI